MRREFWNHPIQTTFVAVTILIAVLIPAVNLLNSYWSLKSAPLFMSLLPLLLAIFSGRSFYRIFAGSQFKPADFAITTTSAITIPIWWAFTVTIYIVSQLIEALSDAFKPLANSIDIDQLEQQRILDELAETQISEPLLSRVEAAFSDRIASAAADNSSPTTPSTADALVASLYWVPWTLFILTMTFSIIALYINSWMLSANTFGRIDGQREE